MAEGPPEAEHLSRRLILTPDQRLRVFISSTLRELATERAAIRDVITRMSLTPVMFELGARPHPPRALYRSYLDQSHVFVGVYWQSYGWVAPEESISGIEDEYRLSDRLPRLLYVKEPAPERDAQLTGLLERIQADDVASYRRFDRAEELAALVEADLAILLAERFEASQPERRLAALASLRNSPPAIPVPLTPTIGRKADIESTGALIRNGARLVTITGIGGVGKTRVASEVIRALRGDFDEVRFVGLGDLVDPGLVTATIAAALGVPVERTQSALDAVAAAIGEDRLLIGLDNLEQLVDAGPELAELLARCPHLQLLITSRHVLRLRGEREYPLSPYSVPAPTILESPNAIARLAAEPAVELFVEHAQAVRPGFRLDPSNAAAVAELCRRLDGLPLAIELVATRIRLLSPEDLLDRFGERLLLLTSGTADLPDRQRTLHATLDWSHRLLDSREQVLFARLGVFSGGASLDAVEEVCGGEPVGDVLETLASLLEKSLVVTVEDAATGPRVAMLYTVRAYAWEKLGVMGDLAATRARHASCYQSLVESCDSARRPGATARWETLDAELPNVRAAVAWLTERDDTARLALFASSLWTWYWIRGRMSEGRSWIESLSPRIDPSDDEQDAAVVAHLCAAVGAVRFSLGEYDSAAELFRRALDGFSEAEDTGGSAQVSCILAAIEAFQGDRSEAIELASRAVAEARGLEVEWSLAHALTVLGGLTRQAGSIELGRALQVEALETVRRIGERVSEGQILGQIAVADLNDGNIPQAHELLLEAVDCCRETRHMEGMAFCLEIGAVVAFAEARPREAATLLGAADAIRERLNIAVLPIMRAGRDALVSALVETLGADENESALTEGRAADPFALLS